MEDPALLLRPEDYGLLTDLYQLTMTACYVGEGLDQRQASFELFTRRLPQDYSYLIVAGLAQALDYLEHLRFTPAQLDALRATGLFEHAPDAFWQRLATGCFSGDVWALPEGTAAFAHEPLLRIDAPLWQAQIAETYLLNTLNYQTLIATRAARLRQAAGPNATLLEFGSRRAFSPQGAIWAARAALVGGLDATSNVLAALKLGQRPAGTMAHALVMAFVATQGSEDDAFAAFHRYFPGAALLIDTYDPLDAAQRLAAAAQTGATPVGAVRLDSGDLELLAKAVHTHLPQAKIFASGDLDERAITRLRRAKAPIDGYGLGTKLVTGDPVNGVYKLVDLDGTPVMKESSQKATYPGRKQIFRTYQDGRAVGDRLGLATEAPAESERQLLELVMQQGRRLQPPPPLAELAQRSAAAVASLPETVQDLEHPVPYPVTLSEALAQLTQLTQRQPVAPA